ncbi:hypothetical protein HG530_010393 [Fusarium avenaceum]|nr:hypothetical protein HG530_010393 [Fusarium avenaceum]
MDSATQRTLDSWLEEIKLTHGDTASGDESEEADFSTDTADCLALVEDNSAFFNVTADFADVLTLLDSFNLDFDFLLFLAIL